VIVLSQCLISGVPTKEIPEGSCISFLSVQVRDELRKETLQLAIEL
jgi:hypothetical protein